MILTLFYHIVHNIANLSVHEIQNILDLKI